MAKKRTREQKIISKLRKLETSQNVESKSAAPKVNSYSFSAPTNSATSSNSSYIKKDLLKILLLATLAISFQVVLSLIISNPNLPFNIPLLGRR